MKQFYRICLLALMALFTVVCTNAQGLKIITGHPDLKIKIKRCEISGSTCVVDMLIENVGSTDVYIEFFGGSYTKVYDDEGDVFTKDNVKISLGNGKLGDYLSETLHPEVPIKARLQIEGIPESVTMLKRINLAMYSQPWGLNPAKDKFIVISNIPISRDGDE